MISLANSGSPRSSMTAKPYWVLALSLLGISFAGPLVRLSSADPVAIAVWRLGFSLLIVAVFLVGTREWRDWSRMTSRELALAGARGVSPPLPFLAWNAAIHLPTLPPPLPPVNLPPA